MGFSRDHIAGVSVIAVLALLFAGCRNEQEKKAGPLHPIVEHTQKPDAALKPYYHGLVEEYRLILQEDPNNLAALIGLGNAYSDSGSWKEAAAQYQRAIRLDPRNADVQNELGTAYRNMGMPDHALTAYRAALALDPGHLNARYNMGVVYAYDLRNYRLAVHIWEELLRLAPNYRHADYMRTCIVTFRKNAGREHP